MRERAGVDLVAYAMKGQLKLCVVDSDKYLEIRDSTS